MAAASTQVCPVVGTTNDVLPPSHPDIDLSRPGQVCPVVGAKTEHHSTLHKHPKVPGVTTQEQSANNHADKCPALQRVVSSDTRAKAMDDGICPVVGTATTVLPPDHPALSDQPDDAVCPVVKAKVQDHKGTIHAHPSVAGAAPGAVCPVAGVIVK